MLPPEAESKDFTVRLRKSSVKRPGSFDDSSALLGPSALLGQSSSSGGEAPSPISEFKKKSFLHRRSRSYDASTPDLTSLKLYSGGGSPGGGSLDLLLEYDYTSSVFDAVNRQDPLQLQTLLQVKDVDINCVNSNGMSALDVALLLDSQPIATCLIQHGAEAILLGPTGGDDITSVLDTLDNLISQCEQTIATLNGAIISNSSKYKLHERKLDIWMNKRNLIRKMKSNYTETDTPLPIQGIQLHSTSPTSLRVVFDDPTADSIRSSPIIGYKVAWSCDPLPIENYNTAPGSTNPISTIIPATSHTIYYDITSLQPEVPYYVTVSAQNMKGFGEPSSSYPVCVAPSSWRNCPAVTSRKKLYDTHQVEELYREVKATRSMDDSSSCSSSESSPSTSHQYTKAPSSLRRGLFGLFSPPPSLKFAKTVKRDSIYLACVMYHKEKILVTEDDRYVPMLEVDDSYSTSHGVSTAFNWMLKVSCHWSDVSQLKSEMERVSNVTSYSIKHQLLTTVMHIQSLLGVQDLGMLHYRPIKDENTGGVVFVFVRQISEPKQLVSQPNLKWTTLTKIYKSTPSSDCLVNLISPEFTVYRELCHQPAPTGLHLGYLQTEFSAGGGLNLLVSPLNPNTLPSVRIRDNPNVTKEEWQSLLELSPPYISESSSESSGGSPLFKKQLVRSIRKLMDSLGISPELVLDHKLYSYEVLEFSPHVSYIVILPTSSNVCYMKRTSTLTDNLPYNSYGMLRVPVKSFEVSHLHTYHPQFIRSYTKAMVLLDMEITAALQAHREAFSSSEIEATRPLVEELKGSSKALEEIWRAACWVSELISVAREKNFVGVPIRILYEDVVRNHKSRSRGSTKTSTDSNKAGYHGRDSSDCDLHINPQERSEPSSSDRSSANSSEHGKAHSDSMTTFSQISLSDILVYDSKLEEGLPLVDIS